MKVVGGATRVMLIALGFAYGSISVWLIPLRLWHGLEGLSLVITLIGNLLAGLLAGWAFETGSSALLPVGGWFLSMAVFTVYTGRGGDVVVPGALPGDHGVVVVGETDWIVGLVSAIAVVALCSQRWGYTQGREQPTSAG